jgi:hypothetical protein
MKAYGGVDIEIRIYLTSALAGGKWSVSRPGRCIPAETVSDIHWIKGWVGPKAGLDDMEKWKFLRPSGLEPRPLGRPARNQSLYRLSYPGSGTILVFAKTFIKILRNGFRVFDAV